MVDIPISNGNYEHVKCTENASYMICSNTMSTQLTVGNDVNRDGRFHERVPCYQNNISYCIILVFYYLIKVIAK